MKITYAAVPTKISCFFAFVKVARAMANMNTKANTVHTIAIRGIVLRNKIKPGVSSSDTAINA